MINADRTPETTPTIRATIRLAGFASALTADVRTIVEGDHEGEMDERHLTELCEELTAAHGCTFPYLAITVDAEQDLGPWIFALIDAASWDEIGTVKVHAGAGA